MKDTNRLAKQIAKMKGESDNWKWYAGEADDILRYIHDNSYHSFPHTKPLVTGWYLVWGEDTRGRGWQPYCLYWDKYDWVNVPKQNKIRWWAEIISPCDTTTSSNAQISDVLAGDASEPLPWEEKEELYAHQQIDEDEVTKVADAIYQENGAKENRAVYRLYYRRMARAAIKAVNQARGYAG